MSDLAVDRAKNIVLAYEACSDAERRTGREWYPNAYNMAKAMDPDAPARAAGVIAALSPQTPWATNVAHAAHLIGWFDDHGPSIDAPSLQTGTQMEKAIDCCYGHDPLDVLRGPKERAFYRSIMGDHDAVCVDRWAARVAEPAADPLKAITPARFRRVEQAYRMAAAAIGDVSPRDLQAITWINARGRED